MASSLTIQASEVDPELLDLPWQLALEDWPSSLIAALPKGISRHTVRFAKLGGHVIAIKETTDEMAGREYDMLRRLGRTDVPCVEPFAIVSGRVDEHGEALPAALVTRHLRFSLPYRALFSQTLRPDTAVRLVDALALLLVHLHNSGFYWGDVSLSNTLFRRDAGAFAAYLVDAETGRLYPSLSPGQREDDLEIARVNIAGELFDLEAGGRLADDVDPIALSQGVIDKYRELWHELTSSESFAANERWRITDRVRRLNELGFDIDELDIAATDEGSALRIRPKVVDAGHHQRRLLRLTGLDAHENQARRLLNDLDDYRARIYDGPPDAGEEMIAHEWVARVFEPVVRSIPRALRGKLEPAEVFHQLLDHRWFESQRQQREIPLSEALTGYLDEVLSRRPDEAQLIAGPATLTTPIALPPPSEADHPES